MPSGPTVSFYGMPVLLAYLISGVYPVQQPLSGGRQMTLATDQPLLHQIHDLVAQERLLRANHAGIGLNAAERATLIRLEDELDRCWELLRQRRAAEEFGEER